MIISIVQTIKNYSMFGFDDYLEIYTYLFGL